jgi:hypothetical protein
MRARWALVFAPCLLLVASGPPSPGPETPIRVADWVQPGPNGSTLVQDPQSPISYELPAGWRLTSGVRWGTHETTLTFLDTRSGLWTNAYYQYPLPNPPAANLDSVLRFGMDNKVKQRQDREGLTDYAIRQSSIQQAVVDGRPALSWVADFTGKGPRHPAMVEYMLRYIGANGKADVFTQVPATTDLTAFVERIQPIIQSLRIP